MAKEWLFAGATIYDVGLLHEDYGKRSLGLDLDCTWQEKKYNIFRCIDDLRDANVASCTASSALAQAVVVHTAGCTVPLDVPKAAGVLSLPDTTAADMGRGALDGHEVFHNMTEDRNKFMAYCMVMRAEGCLFNWPGEVLEDDMTGHWALDKLTMALCYPLLNKDVFSENPGLVDKVLACWEEGDAHAAVKPAKPAKSAKSQKKPKTVEDTAVEDKLSPEQIEKIVPLMLRNTQVGSSVQVSELHGKGIEEQIDMFTLSAEMLESARNKNLKRFKNAEGQIAFTSVHAANRCTTVLTVNPKEGQFTEASRDRAGSQVEDYRFKIGEVAHFSTMMMHDKLTKPLLVPMKVQSQELHNYLRALSELPEEFGDSMENVCYATAVVQAGHRAAQLDSGQDTRNLSPYVMLYRVYQADEFYKLMGQLYKEFAQTDGTFRVITMIPHTFFVNWYICLAALH